MKLMISVDIILMTFRQQIKPKSNKQFSQSCDQNFSTKWSRVSSLKSQILTTGTTAVMIANRVKHDLNSVHTAPLF